VAKLSDKARIDVLLFERGIVESRELARRMIMAGEVTVNDLVVTKPGTHVSMQARIELKSKPRFVSRGGEKLAAALVRFQIDPAGWICADIGASTGGFTDCLLQNGAMKIYAIDVGYGQLAWSLRQDARVVVMERTNARSLDALPEPIDFASVDVSFISLNHILPTINRILKSSGEAVVLVKPQFEAGREDVGKGGVIKDPTIHVSVLNEVVRFAQDTGLYICGLMPSPLRGPAGNIEFLMWLSHDLVRQPNSLKELIDAVVEEAHSSQQKIE